MQASRQDVARCTLALAAAQSVSSMSAPTASVLAYWHERDNHNDSIERRQSRSIEGLDGGVLQTAPWHPGPRRADGAAESFGI